MPRDKKDPKNPNLKTFVTSSLRRASYRWPARNRALANARVERGLYKCAMCQGTFPKDQVHIDHIEPVVNLDGFTTWDSFIERLFCPVEKFQILCIQDHNTKTTIEDEMRKTLRKDKKT